MSPVINNLSIQYNEKSKLRSPWDVWLSPSPVWASCGRVSGEWKKAMVGFSLSAPPAGKVQVWHLLHSYVFKSYFSAGIMKE